MHTELPETLHILIVDDMKPMRQSLRAMLKLIRPTWRIVEAPDGREAWRMIERGEAPVDFIVSDWNMPHLSGTELLHRVRSNRATRHIPFLMITAEANKEIVAEAAENDVDAYLTKPFVTATLEKKIAELLYNAAHPSPLARLLQRIEELEEAGQIDEAVKLAEQAVALGKRSSRPYRILGRLHLKRGDRATARKWLEKAVAMNQLDVASFHLLGRIATDEGNLDAAIGYFARAMDINPRHADRAIEFASLLARKKEHRRAEKVFRLVLRAHQHDPDRCQEIAQHCFDLGLFDLAAKAYEHTLRLDPSRSDLAKQLGMALRRKGQPREALPHLERALAEDADNIDLLLEIAHCHLACRKPIPAERYAVKVIRLDPNNAEARKILDAIDQ